MNLSNVKKELKNYRKWLGVLMTGVLTTALFYIIFVTLGLADYTDKAFWLELLMVFSITTQVRLYWIDFYEKKTLEEDKKITTSIDKYNDRIETLNIDIYNFEDFLETYNQERREYYFKNKTRYLTPENCKKYNKKIQKFKKKRDKIRPITSSDVLTRNDNVDIGEVKNKLKLRKIIFQVLSGTYTLFMFTLIGLVELENFAWSWGKAVRFATYLGYMGFAILGAISFSISNTKKSTLEQLIELQKVLDKYEAWIKKGGSTNGNNDGTVK